VARVARVARVAATVAVAMRRARVFMAK